MCQSKENTLSWATHLWALVWNPNWPKTERSVAPTWCHTSVAWGSHWMCTVLILVLMFWQHYNNPELYVCRDIWLLKMKNQITIITTIRIKYANSYAVFKNLLFRSPAPPKKYTLYIVLSISYVIFSCTFIEDKTSLMKLSNFRKRRKRVEKEERGRRWEGRRKGNRQAPEIEEGIQSRRRNWAKSRTHSSPGTGLYHSPGDRSLGHMLRTHWNPAKSCLVHEQGPESVHLLWSR